MAMGKPKLGWYGIRDRGVKYQARWVDGDGMRSETFNTRAQARKHAMRMANEALDVKVGLSTLRKPIMDAKRAFLDRPTKANTRALNDRRISEFLAKMPGIRDTSALTHDHMNKYAGILTEAGHNAGGREHHLKLVRAFTNFCLEQKWIEKNPFEKFIMPKSDYEGRALTDEEYARIVSISDRYKEVDTWLNLAVRLGRSTLLRISQVWSLQASDFVEPNQLKVWGIKGQDTEWKPLRPEAAEILRGLIRAQPTGRLFTRWGSVEAMRNAFEDKVRRVGLPGVRFHDACKVTGISALSKEGFDPAELELLSNTSKATLIKHYLKADKARTFARYLGQPGASFGPSFEVSGGPGSERKGSDGTKLDVQNASTSQQIPVA